MKEEKIYIGRILRIIDSLESYVLTDNFDDFIENEMKIDATLMKLQALWETVKKIWKYPNIPYKEIIWLRDWISHDYFWLDLETIWNTLKIDIPELKVKIEDINKKLK